MGFVKGGRLIRIDITGNDSDVAECQLSAEAGASER